MKKTRMKKLTKMNLIFQIKKKLKFLFYTNSILSYFLMSFSNNIINNSYQKSPNLDIYKGNHIFQNMAREVYAVYGNTTNLNKAVYSQYTSSSTSSSNYYCQSDSKPAGSHGSCVIRAYYGIQPGITSLLG